MDTDNLKLFIKAVELKNISAAGHQLGFPPAVSSARLTKLENQIGADLLHRSTRKISLSPEGEKFLPFAQNIIQETDSAIAALGHEKDKVSGTLRFACSSTFAQLFIAPILPDFLRKYPHVNLDLKLTDRQTNLIESGVDLALCNYILENSNLRARKLAEDTRILCASPGYIAQHGTPEILEDLQQHQILMFRNSKPRKLMHSDGSHMMFPDHETKKRIICDDGASMRIATQSGAGISMNAYWSVHQQIQDGSLVRVLPHYVVEESFALWLVYPKSTIVPSKVRTFIDFLIEKVGNHPALTKNHNC